MAWELFFWEPTLSPHRTGLLQALARRSDVQSVTMVAHADISAARKAQGWSTPTLDCGEIHVGLPGDSVQEIIRTSSPASVHMINGMRGSETIKSALAAAAKYRKRYGITSEPRVREGASGLVRYLQSVLTEQQIIRTSDFVMGIGAHGPSWFKNVGYRTNTIFPFAYFVDRIVTDNSPRASSDINVVYLGRLDKEKAIDTFLDAIPLLRRNVKVTVAGHGPLLSKVYEAVAKSNGRAEYIGVLPMSEVPAFLSKADVIVVPSRSTNDGWGVVVTEALMSGAAVVASRKVGASVLLNNPDRGRCIPPNDPRAIAAAVDAIIEADELSTRARAARSAWANEALSSEGGAEYLLAILHHLYRGGDRPPPFYA